MTAVTISIIRYFVICFEYCTGSLLQEKQRSDFEAFVSTAIVNLERGRHEYVCVFTFSTFYCTQTLQFHGHLDVMPTPVTFGQEV